MSEFFTGLLPIDDDVVRNPLLSGNFCGWHGQCIDCIQASLGKPAQLDPQGE
jgi:hypothetical protein